MVDDRADDRNEREIREQRNRYDEQRGERASRDSGGERGFFERAGDEISSWFGDDETGRRRDRDERSGSGRDAGRRPLSSEDDRGPRYRDEAQRRPYSGRPPERSEMNRDLGRRGPEYDREQGASYRPMAGDYGRSSNERFEREPSNPATRGSAPATAATGATAAHDRHYGEWRQRQIDEIDRDYDEYRREHQAKFESDFSNWRSTRQAKRQLLSSIKEHMAIVGSDEQPLGTVDKVRGDRVVLTSDSPDGQHLSVNCSMIDRVEGDRVILDRTAADAKMALGSEERDRALFERDDQGEPGAHILGRSFSGTY